MTTDLSMVIYEKFRIKQDKEYISSMDQMLNKYLKENK